MSSVIVGDDAHSTLKQNRHSSSADFYYFPTASLPPLVGAGALDAAKPLSMMHRSANLARPLASPGRGGGAAYAVTEGLLFFP